MNQTVRSILGTIALCVGLGACLSLIDGCHQTNSHDGAADVLSIRPLKTGNWYRPAPLATWHWQLQGRVDGSVMAEVYGVDLFNVTPRLVQQLLAQGVRLMCYFSAGSYEPYRDDAADFYQSDLGEPLEGWPDERWLDIRSVRVFNIMLARLDLAKEKGCDAVEADNVDGFEHPTGFPLTASDQLNYARRLANAAHERGMAIGLKNNLSQLEALVDFYDFAVNEECDSYNECERLLVFTSKNKAVFHAEYARSLVSDTATWRQFCERSQALGLSSSVLPLSLDGSFRYSCL
jgi:hypothetical protein